MGRVIAVANQKGGVGKTVTSINLAASLAARGRRTLLIDLDPQGHCGVGLGVDTEPLERTSYDLLVDRDVTVADVASPVPWPELASLSFVPSNLRLALAERELSRAVPIPNLALASKLKSARSAYDEIVLDCPPSLSKLTLNAFLACDVVLIPVAVGFFSIHGVRMLAETLKDIFEETGLDHDVRCLITRYRAGQTVSREVRRAADEMFGDFCFASVIRESADVEKSVGAQMPLVVYAPRSAPAMDYQALADELLDEVVAKETDEDLSEQDFPDKDVASEEPKPGDASPTAAAAQRDDDDKESDNGKQAEVEVEQGR